MIDLASEPRYSCEEHGMLVHVRDIQNEIQKNRGKSNDNKNFTRTVTRVKVLRVEFSVEV